MQRGLISELKLSAFRALWRTVGYKRSTELLFLAKHGYWPNLQSPRTLSEKIQWAKLHGQLERFAPYVDKFEVRDYIRNVVGEQYLVPIVGIYDDADAVDFNLLPDRFILKATHGSSWNFIVKDKRKLDVGHTKQMLRKWLKANYYECTGEANYRPLKGRILVEHLLEDGSGDLKDYKFFCFHGRPEYVQVDACRFTDHRRDFFDINWVPLPLRVTYQRADRPPNKPECFDEMLAVCTALSAPFAFVRVDLYYCNGRVYVGELTFTPGNGMEKFEPREYDLRFGELLDLTRY